MAARSQKLYSELVELESARTAVLTTNEIETRLIDCDVALNIRAKEFGAAIAHLCLERLFNGESDFTHEWFAPEILMSKSG